MVICQEHDHIISAIVVSALCESFNNIFQNDRNNELVSNISFKVTFVDIIDSFLESRTSGTVMLSTLGTMSETIEKKLGKESKKP